MTSKCLVYDSTADDEGDKIIGGRKNDGIEDRGMEIGIWRNDYEHGFLFTASLQKCSWLPCIPSKALKSVHFM